MKKLIIAMLFVSIPAYADESQKQPTTEEITAQANALITSVRSQRDACNDQVAQLAVQLDKLTKEIASLKKPAPGEPMKK